MYFILISSDPPEPTANFLSEEPQGQEVVS